MLSGNFAEMTTSTSFRDLLHAANLRHGTDGFTSPSEGRRAEDYFVYNSIYTINTGTSVKCSTICLRLCFVMKRKSATLSVQKTDTVAVM